MPNYTINLYPQTHVRGIGTNSSVSDFANKSGPTIFTDNGAVAHIQDDDSVLEDINTPTFPPNNPETGDNAVLTESFTLGGTTYSAGTQINAIMQVEVTNDTTGETGFAQLIQFGGPPISAGPTYVAYPFSVSEGDNLTWIATNNDAGVPVGERLADTSGYEYSEFDGEPSSVSTPTVEITNIITGGDTGTFIDTSGKTITWSSNQIHNQSSTWGGENTDWLGRRRI